MSTTTEAAALADIRRDIITMPTVEDRAAALRRMAEEQILDEQHPGARDLNRCQELIVRALASTAVADTVLTRFEQLVEAVREQQSYTSDPRGYADENDLPATDRTLDSIDESLTGQVEVAIWDLLSPTPACSSCRRSRRRSAWKPALWPASQFCAEHRPVSA